MFEVNNELMSILLRTFQLNSVLSAPAFWLPICVPHLLAADIRRRRRDA